MRSKGKGKKKKTVVNKEENAESWCFVCKDGGDLIICDHAGCRKSYHPSCLKNDDSVVGSEANFICDWHTCSICCKRSSSLHCYTCTRAVCRRCLHHLEVFRVKGKYGFCKHCLKLSLLIEGDKDYDSDGEKVDFEDLNTVEGLFWEYYMIIKKEEGLELQDLYAAKDGVKTMNISESSSEENHEEDEISDYDGAEHVKKCRRTSSEKRSGRKKLGFQIPMKLSKNDFIGWGSRALIDFLSSIGKSTDEQLSHGDVTSIVYMYVKENKLMHPEKRKMISCDALLQSLFRKKTITKNKVHELLRDHFAEYHDESEEDGMGYDSEDENAGISDVCKKQRKLNTERKPPEKELVDDVPLGCFASLVGENVKLVYLRRSLLIDLLKQPKSFAEKVVGCFVRVKSDPYDYCSRNSHQLMQVRGVKRDSICQNNIEAEAILLISALPGEISTSQLSDDDFSEEECEDLRRKVLAGLLERPTVEYLQQKVNILHEDLMKHWVIKELALLKNLIDRANEKGWRRELYEYLEKKRRLQTPSEVSKLLASVPKVIPDRCELHHNPEDTVNDMSIEKDSPKANLECNSPVTNHGWQDDKESDEKTRQCNPSPPARKESIFKEPEDDNMTSRKASQPTGEARQIKLGGEELKTCSQMTTSHEQATRTGCKASDMAVIEVPSDVDEGGEATVVQEDENTDDSEWCLETPTGERRKFQSSVLKTWSQTCLYASKFKVWREGENENTAVWLFDAFPKK
ncbi:uncharacterized protein At5g08430-like isoform X2 [Salvia splendens]|uniref:uncharacterized protein At5g08430-like isoform X2 n=1 Tax=Salvia splendens TaxID=180675 RepID=UPI001C2537C0|nr:uncharacterized protein At5g08430-like isoform X2 [Salvia splendens]